MAEETNSFRDRIDPLDWSILLDAYYYAAAAVSLAGDTGRLGHNRELHVLGSGRLGVAATVLPAEPLVQELAGADGKEFDPAIPAEAPPDTDDAGQRDYYASVATRLCAQAGDVAARVLSTDEAVAYRHWVLELCAAVAYSAKEGSHLGIGGVELSEPEAALIEAIAAALGEPGWQPNRETSRAAARAARRT
jgi:hypothetical protein